MKKKLLAALLSMAMVALCLTGCGGTTEPAATPEAEAPAPEEPAAPEAEAPAEPEAEAPVAAGSLIGVSMPTQDLQRWNQDGANMESQLIAAGYEVDLQYAGNDVATQVSQVENMVANGAQVLVIAAIDADSLVTVLEEAKANNIPVIAYDRLINGTDAISYYATFDNYKVGQTQGQYIIDTLDLNNAEGPFNIEFIAGDPGDTNAPFFFNGAMDLLKPFIDSGKLVVQSGQTDFETVATQAWNTETAQARMENIISSYYADGTVLDVIQCSNDSTAMGATNAIDSSYNGEQPIITGQDCDLPNVLNMIAGKQSMSVFKDTRTLAAQTVTMVDALMKGEEAPVNDTSTYDNGTGFIPTFQCEPVFADVNNYQELLIDSGYYTADQLQ